MKKGNYSRSKTLSLAISLGEWRARLLYIFLTFLALLLVALNKSESPATQAIRNTLTDILAPAVSFIAQPIEGAQSFGDQWQQWQDVYAQNAALREENAKLRQWHRLSAGIYSENKALRDLLKLAPTTAGHFISGKMLGNLAGSFSQSQWVSVGETDGASKDMAVLSADGMIGRVIEVANNTSRIMLVTDINSHIAVQTQQGREQAMAVGRNQALLELRYLPKKSAVKLGEMIITSGDAGLMPAGIPIGRVVKIGAGQVLVRLRGNLTFLAEFP
jgi:rod shape-determining protein MreC